MLAQRSSHFLGFGNLNVAAILAISEEPDLTARGTGQQINHHPTQLATTGGGGYSVEGTLPENIFQKSGILLILESFAVMNQVLRTNKF